MPGLNHLWYLQNIQMYRHISPCFQTFPHVCRSNLCPMQQIQIQFDHVPCLLEMLEERNQYTVYLIWLYDAIRHINVYCIPFKIPRFSCVLSYFCDTSIPLIRTNNGDGDGAAQHFPSWAHSKAPSLHQKRRVLIQEFHCGQASFHRSFITEICSGTCSSYRFLTCCFHLVS